MKPGKINSIIFFILTSGIALAIALLSVTNSNAKSSAAYDKSVSMELNFLFHVEADMAEQDVFIERDSGSGVVYRATKADRDMDAPLFYPAKPIGHSPFNPGDIGPYPRGKPMGFTLGEWYAGSGKATYTCENGQGTIKARFNRLRPGAVYTMWHFFFVSPPTKPSIGTYDIPMGSRDGTQSIFHTDKNGNATFKKTIKPCLQLSGEHLASGLAISWHSDGKTYGPLPGEFSINSHVQLFTVLPKRTGI